MCYRLALHLCLRLLRVILYDEYFGATTATPFLPSPIHLVIPWEQWIQAFKNYMVASGASDLPARRRKAILLNCLGLEGQRIFQTLTSEDDPRLLASSAAGGISPGPDEFDRAIAMLEDHYKSFVNVTAARHHFRCAPFPLCHCCVTVSVVVHKPQVRLRSITSPSYEVSLEHAISVTWRTI
ncbi:hypothetical protein HPB49_003978 [Dermacentor silvarum]|uniref:Uncharacterized protein n=1 Tax=Dermacentor silvarum TaxID=543639 RepID=A0ACB8DAL2_DERSI|nr:hypothetical protein HPB49_003978 [Dermacentor silvarum]